MATPDEAQGGAAALARIVADDALMAAIPADAARKIGDELLRREEEAKAERIQAEKDNVVKGEQRVLHCSLQLQFIIGQKHTPRF